ncbi:MAG: hypothetical protein ACLTDR_07335 [Adlercreutzia equolifaciens]
MWCDGLREHRAAAGHRLVQREGDQSTRRAASRGDHRFLSGGVVRACAPRRCSAPTGALNKNLVGLYSVSTKKWIVPLAEGSLSFTSPPTALPASPRTSKERLIEGYGAEGDGSSDARYSCSDGLAVRRHRR